MKKRFSLIAVALAVSATTAHADPAPTAELKVTGTLDVPACTVTAGDDGIYDYGDLNPTDILPGTAVKALPMISKPWTIECTGDTYLSFKVVDNAMASRAVAASENFGLGMVNSTGRLGYFTLTMRNPKVNNAVSRAYATATTSIAPAAAVAVRQDNHTMGWATTGANTQAIGSKFEADMEVIATLAGSTTMNGPITDDVDLAGSLTLNFAYGL